MPTPSSDRLREPVQRRGRETLDRIVRAAEEIISEDGVAAATVKAVMARAGVGPGSFYARFEGRDALLAHVRDRFWSRAGDIWRGVSADELPDGASPAAVGGELVRRLVRVQGRHEDTLRALLVDALTDPAGPAMERAIEMDEAVLDGGAEMLTATGVDPERSRTALLQVVALIRQMILFPDAELLPAQIGERDLILGLTRHLLGGLGVPGAPAEYGTLLGNSASLYRR